MTRWSRASGVVQDVVDGCAVLIDPSGAEIVRVNAVGTLVWEHLDAEEQQLVAAVRQQWPGVDPGQAERDVSAFLRELASHGLVEQDGELLRDA